MSALYLKKHISVFTKHCYSSFFCILILSSFLYSCKEETETSPKNAPIGSYGGTITSSEKTASLIIPPGALSNEVQISIKNTNHTALNGIGNTYELLPDGQKFQKPITLTFIYTDALLAASNITTPQQIRIAAKKMNGTWEIVPTTINEMAKTVSAQISHFSEWTMLSGSSIQTLGPEGGTITSSDGMLTLTIPKGSLTKQTQLAIEAVEEKFSVVMKLATHMYFHQILFPFKSLPKFLLNTQMMS